LFYISAAANDVIAVTLKIYVIFGASNFNDTIQHNNILLFSVVCLYYYISFWIDKADQEVRCLSGVIVVTCFFYKLILYNFY